MISSKKAMAIMFEMDDERRNMLVDELPEEDAVQLLKVCLKAMQEALTGNHFLDKQ